MSGRLLLKVIDDIHSLMRIRLCHTIVLFCLMPLTLMSCASSVVHDEGPFRDSPEIHDLTVSMSGFDYPCRVIINEYARKGGPAVLFLHGYGECGDDNEKQLTVGLPKHALENPEMWPFVLIVPQKLEHNEEWEVYEFAIRRMLDKAEEMELFDPDRLGITGLSQGGHGTIGLARLWENEFVAAAPVCGYLRPFFTEDRERIDQPAAQADMPEYKSAAQSLREVPIWFWHGDADPVVPVDESRALHGALQALDAKCNYTELPGVDHNAWDAAYSSKELAAWFAKHLSED